MFYENTMTATFLHRPNRFLAHVLAGDTELICHVKNTGRLGELLIPGAPVIIQHHPKALTSGRKTEYSLIGVKKSSNTDEIWVNIDSLAPNQAAYEWFLEGRNSPLYPIPGSLRREAGYGRARFDLFFTCNGTPWFVEVKGVTLERNGIGMFPDAPTKRGVKHLQELAAAAKDGYGAGLLFIIQMKGISSFTPNTDTQPEFTAALRAAANAGVHIWAYDCVVTENSMRIDMPVSVLL